jgi:hypothetical protein
VREDRDDVPVLERGLDADFSREPKAFLDQHIPEEPLECARGAILADCLEHFPKTA